MMLWNRQWIALDQWEQIVQLSQAGSILKFSGSLMTYTQYFYMRMSIPQNQNLCCGARVVQVPPGTADGMRFVCTRRYKNSYVAWEVLE